MSSLMCMALVIFSEARGEPLRGKQAVAEVVATRSIEWNKDVCGVIYQKGQFTGIRNVKPPKEGTPARKVGPCELLPDPVRTPRVAMVVDQAEQSLYRERPRFDPGPGRERCRRGGLLEGVHLPRGLPLPDHAVGVAPDGRAAHVDRAFGHPPSFGSVALYPLRHQSPSSAWRMAGAAAASNPAVVAASLVGSAQTATMCCPSPAAWRPVWPRRRVQTSPRQPAPQQGAIVCADGVRSGMGEVGPPSSHRDHSLTAVTTPTPRP